jgi:hypothetical protein
LLITPLAVMASSTARSTRRFFFSQSPQARLRTE